MAVISIRVAIGVYGFLMLLTAWEAWEAKQRGVLFEQPHALCCALVVSAGGFPE